MNFLNVVTFIAIIAAVKADYPKEKDENDNKIIAACRAEIKITDEDYTNLRYGKVADTPDENMLCLANCFMEKAGVVKDNKLQEDAFVQLFTKKVGEEKAKKILESCRGESGPAKCETAYKLHLCFLENEAY